MQIAECLAAGADWENTDLVFTTPTGGPVNPRNFLRVLQTSAKRAQVKGATIHAFRHSAASTLLDDGVNVRAVRDMLGHSSAQITLDVYGHTLDDTARQAADNLEQRFVLPAGSRADKAQEAVRELRSV